jgi:uncharacterized protein (DUF885 family)
MIKLRALGALAGVLLVASVGQAAESEWIARSNENAKLLLEADAHYDPETASQLGEEAYDEAILDLSRDRYAQQQAELRAVIVEYRRRLAAESDTHVKQDLQILIDAAEQENRTHALARKYFLEYTDVAQTIFNIAQETIDPQVSLARQQHFLVRLQKYAGLARGYRPVAELARERTLERLKADTGGKLLGPYRGQLEQTIKDNPTYLAGIKDLLEHSALRGWEPSYAALEQQLTDYNSWLGTTLLKHARAEARLPPEAYANNLRVYGVDMPPAELISRALTAFAEIRNQMQIAATLVAQEQGLPDSDYRAVIRALKQQQIPDEQVLPLYRQRLAQIEDLIRANHIITLPERKASIRLATPAENAETPAPHMDPPRLLGNTGEYGEFVLATALPPDPSGKQARFDDFSHQAVTWTLTAHEARPGHELQYAKMVELGVSTARAIYADNSANVEGWALYCEAEMQPFEPHDGQLFTLQMRAHRAARAFLDPMLNLGLLSAEQVKRFLMESVGFSEAFATSEVQRYQFRSPGQATSYFYGYQQLMATRQAAQLALSEKFDRQQFNDFVISQGLLPPGLMRTAVMDEFVPAVQGR